MNQIDKHNPNRSSMSSALPTLPSLQDKFKLNSYGRRATLEMDAQQSCDDQYINTTTSYYFLLNLLETNKYISLILIIITKLN